MPATLAPGPSAIAVNMPPVPPAAAPEQAAPPATTTIAPPATDRGPAPTQSDSLDKMFDRIGEKFGRDPSEATATSPKKAKAKPADTPKQQEEPKPEQPTEPKVDEDEDDPVKAPEKTAPEPKPEEAKPEAKDGKKENPYKVIDRKSKEIESLKAELAEVRKFVPEENARKAESARIQKLEADYKEAMEKIRFYDYREHPEFKDKYEKPYNEKWGEIWSELSGASVTEGESQRQIQPGDIARLGNLPAHTLIKEAKQMFGEDVGPWVAERVRELRNLAKAKTDALEKVKTEGAERAAKEQETLSTQEKELNSALEQNWIKANGEIESHSKYGEFLKPREGDDEHNQAIERGAEFVKKAWTLDPREKGITPEERAARTKRQVKLQRYASGFAALYLSEQRWRQKYEAAAEKLKGYEASTPKIDGGQIQPATPAQNGYTMDSFGAALAAKARPGVV